MKNRKLFSLLVLFAVLSATTWRTISLPQLMEKLKLTETTLRKETIEATTDPTTTDTPETIAICSIQSEEINYLDEWVDYHLALGFSQIYVYDNSPRLELQQWERNGDSGTVTVVPFPGDKMQMPAYKDCALRAKAQNHTWVFFADCDEFLVLKKHSSVVDFAKEKIQYGQLGINWRVFGTSGRQSYQPLPVLKRFQCRMHEEYEHNIFVKSIVRISDLALDKPFVSPHVSPIVGNSTGSVDTNGNPTSFQGINVGGPTDVAVIYHFHLKSKEEYIRKRMRGSSIFQDKDVDDHLQKALKGLDSMGYPLENGQVFDDTAWILLKRMVPEYAAYDQLATHMQFPPSHCNPPAEGNETTTERLENYINSTSSLIQSKRRTHMRGKKTTANRLDKFTRFTDDMLRYELQARAQMRGNKTTADSLNDFNNNVTDDMLRYELKRRGQKRRQKLRRGNLNTK